ncbi:MAG: aminotransferase class I/II-fold pyridoxal phosphate-dependent enzyme [Desulfobacteraceae bacterium]|nr:aminotransferase class I/II-fold pyridoxal phosphate-dependent enzyme [Desulfobacteraceae bacterium]
MAQTKTFLKDDYERINKKYFNQLRKDDRINADPSYWFNPESTVSHILGIEYLQKYNSDFNSGLNFFKDRIIKLVEKWDNFDFCYDSITLCNSVTSGSLVILSSLKLLGVEEIFFETPAYFASIEQAEKLGFKTTLLPTYSHNDFKMDVKLIENSSSRRKAVWITQPKFALGSNQKKADIEEILNSIRKEDFLVIDEATEQFFPSVLNEFNCKKHKNVIKVRSFFKGMGINGPRISFIIHSKELRDIFRIEIEKMQGSIDYFSLNFLFKIASDVDRFELMLKVANEQVVGNFKTIEKISVGTLVTPSKLINGYIGSVQIDLSHLKMKHLKARETFLKFCHKNKLPVIIGSNMNFAIEEQKEFVRLNCFNQHEDLFKGVEILSKFS